MTLPDISPTQQTILPLIYRFRFLNTLHIQKLLHHKSKGRINDWLKDLTAKGYIERIYDPHDFRRRTEFAIYHLDNNGIRFLKTQDGYCLSSLKSMYRENTRSQQFRERCSLIADICLRLDIKTNGKTIETVSYGYATQSDFANVRAPFHFLKDLAPHLVISKKENGEIHWYLFEVCEKRPHRSLRKRIRYYIKFFYSGVWEEQTNSQFPTILLACHAPSTMISLKWYARSLLSYEERQEIHIKFATVSDIMQDGVTGKDWEGI